LPFRRGAMIQRCGDRPGRLAHVGQPRCARTRRGHLLRPTSPRSEAPDRISPKQLVRPAEEHLTGYLDALDRGRSPDPGRRRLARAQRRRIESDATTCRPGWTTARPWEPPSRRPTARRRRESPALVAGCGIASSAAPSVLAGNLTRTNSPTLLRPIGYTVVLWKQRRATGPSRCAKCCLAEAEGYRSSRSARIWAISRRSASSKPHSTPRPAETLQTNSPSWGNQPAHISLTAPRVPTRASSDP
jgi:hypothetical protein